MYLGQRYRNCRRYSVPTSSASVPDKKLVSMSLADPPMASASNNDPTAYERNVAVMIQIYGKKSKSDDSHMMKLLKMTHNIRRDKINTSTLFAVAIKEDYPFLGTENGYVKVSCS